MILIASGKDGTPEREKQKSFPGLYVAKSLIDDVNFRSHKWVYFIWSTPWVVFSFGWLVVVVG